MRKRTDATDADLAVAPELGQRRQQPVVGRVQRLN